MIDAALVRLLAFLKAFLARYFDNFRIGEFAVSVGAAYTAMYQLALQIGIPMEKAKLVGMFGAGIGALLYIRNPKKLDWAATTPAPAPIPQTIPQGNEPGAAEDTI
jgi:hypothetical protein